MKLALVFAASAASVALLVTSASAAVTFDPSTGTGFVGKGDVQTALGWNNKQLQTGAEDLVFAYSATSMFDTTWTCTKNGATNTQERENTTIRTTQGVVDSVARERNQVTGFHLDGFSGSPSSSEDKFGPLAGSCPNNWSVTDMDTGTPVVTGGGLTVNGVPLS